MPKSTRARAKGILATGAALRPMDFTSTYESIRAKREAEDLKRRRALEKRTKLVMKRITRQKKNNR
jgi:hypothetical protein